MTPRRPTPTLSAPIEWRLWRNRWRKDAIVVSISTFENRNLISVRTYATNTAGQMVATVKGVSLVIEKLPELHAALGKALKQAQALGLLPPGDGDGA